MKQNKLCFNPVDYSPQRFGLSYTPPQIVVEYMIPSSGKLYHHKIKFQKFSPETKISDVIEEIYKKHNKYLMHQRVSKAQIIQLVEKLREKYSCNEVYEKMIDSNKDENSQQLKDEGAQTAAQILENYNFDTNEDMNKLSKEELDLKKRAMDIFYNKNNIKIGDEDFQYDVRRDFNNEQYAAEWDDDFV